MLRNVIYLLLGSNMNNRINSLEEAVLAIETRIGRISGRSSVYETEPWGFQAKNRFLNQVVRVETTLDAPEVLNEILEIETSLGRIRDPGSDYASRSIDIDILFFNDEIIEEEDLVIPHPRIPDRMFTLVPLSELNQYLIHPGLRKTIRQLINECRDPLAVYPYKPMRQA